MRILILGAGSIGGYFGGRLIAAGRDVTFLVRPARAARLAEAGLRLRSPAGDAHLPAPRTVLAGSVAGPYDLVLLSCKSYDLDDAIDAVRPAVGPETAVLPLLNGMRHLDTLDAAFGGARVLAGLCQISTDLAPDGTVLHLSPMSALVFGERTDGLTDRTAALAETLDAPGYTLTASPRAMQAMWEKWVMIATAAGITCLMRASVGDIVTAGAGSHATRLLDECAGIAAEAGHAPDAAWMARMRGMFGEAGSRLTASMLRDVERGGRTEADHVLGDLLARARTPGTHPTLEAAYAHLRSYEARRAREAG